MSIPPPLVSGLGVAQRCLLRSCGLRQVSMAGRKIAPRADDRACRDAEMDDKQYLRCCCSQGEARASQHLVGGRLQPPKLDAVVREGLWENSKHVPNFGWDVVIVNTAALMSLAFADPGVEARGK